MSIEFSSTTKTSNKKLVKLQGGSHEVIKKKRTPVTVDALYLELFVFEAVLGKE